VKVLDFGLARCSMTEVYRVGCADRNDGFASRNDYGDGGVHVSGAGERETSGSHDRCVGIRLRVYEMLAGVPAFPGKTVGEILEKALSGT
jgi:hypothetical protein